MLRLAAIGGAFLIGCALAAPAGADVRPSGEKIVGATPGCPCPPIVHRRVRVHVRHHHFGPPPVVVVREGPDFYNFLFPSPYDSAYSRVVTDHFQTPVVTGFDEPWRPKPVWPGVLPYRMAVEGGILQFDGLTGRYVPLAREDAALVAAALPPPPPPPKSWF
jgi:hypothetical protein